MVDIKKLVGNHDERNMQDCLGRFEASRGAVGAELLSEWGIQAPPGKLS